MPTTKKISTTAKKTLAVASTQPLPVTPIPQIQTVKPKNFSNLQTPAYIMSILGGIFAIFSVIGGIVLASFMVAYTEDWTWRIADAIWNSPDFNKSGVTFEQLQELVNHIYLVLIIGLYIGAAFSVVLSVFNWVGARLVAKTMETGQYHLAIYILQLFSFPFGLVAGILMIVARSKSRNLNKPKAVVNAD